jgi:hypothetical protein
MGASIKSSIERIEQSSRLTTNPRYSVTLLAIQKIRVLLVYVLRSIIECRLLRQAHRHSKRANRANRNKDALIIAGGPSVNRLDVSSIITAQSNGELDVFALNWFPLSNLSQTLVPNFFCLSDPLCKPSSKTLFKGQSVEKIWDYLRSQPTIKLILPHNWKKYNKSFNNKVEIWIDDRELVGWSRSNSVIKPRGYASVTAHKAIAAAVFMGYRAVFLIGLDNSVFKNVVVTEKNELGDNPSHFYDSDSTPTLIHKKSAFPFGMQDYLYNHSCLFLDLQRSFAKNPIVNLDVNSLTDSFSKVERFLKA